MGAHILGSVGERSDTIKYKKARNGSIAADASKRIHMWCGFMCCFFYHDVGLDVMLMRGAYDDCLPEYQIGDNAASLFELICDFFAMKCRIAKHRNTLRLQQKQNILDTRSLLVVFVHAAVWYFENQLTSLMESCERWKPKMFNILRMVFVSSECDSNVSTFVVCARMEH